LLVQPRPLHVSLLLRVVLFAVNFSNKVRNNLGTLRLHRTDTCTSIKYIVVGTFLEFCLGIGAVEVSVLGVESAHIMGLFVVRDD
jgi:hypothetical protein